MVTVFDASTSYNSIERFSCSGFKSKKFSCDKDKRGHNYNPSLNLFTSVTMYNKISLSSREIKDNTAENTN